MEWFLYDNGIRQERVKRNKVRGIVSFKEAS